MIVKKSCPGAAGKKAVFLVIGLFLAIAIISTMLFFFWPAPANQGQGKEENTAIFAMYQQYGLDYDKKTDRFYYNGELVRYFEDIVNADNYKKWPNPDGTVDVYAVRNQSGELVGVESFDKKAFMDRTPYLQDAADKLEITKNIDGCTANIEEQVKNRIEDAYEIYKQYGLKYDKESDRLYYEGELVGFFEDHELGHSFGPFDDSIIVINAVRDSHGALTGLNIDYSGGK